EQQFFPNSDRPELLVDINLPPGTAFSVTEATVSTIEQMIIPEPEATVVTSYIGQGMPRFVLASDPLLPNPAYGQAGGMTDVAHAHPAAGSRSRSLTVDWPDSSGSRSAAGGHPERHPGHRDARWHPLG